MEHYLKITVCLLLIVQTCQLASLPESTDSPGRTIDRGWLRQVHKIKQKGGIKKVPVATDEPGYESEPFAEALDSNNVEADGIPSGYMMFGSSGESSENKTSGNPVLPPQFSNQTDEKPQVSNTTAAPTTTTTSPSNSSQTNMTGAEEELHNSTMTNQTSSAHSGHHNSTMTNQTSTAHSSHHNHTPHNRTHLHTTTLAPEKNEGLDNSTEGNNTTTTTTATTTATPGSNETSLTSSSTTAVPSETTGADPEPTTPLAPFTPEVANMTDKEGASGGGADRGLASDPHKSRRHGAWAAVLGTAVAVGIVGLVAYVILKKKHQMGFSHRKLVEVYPSDPVLRLDNSEPLDLNFGNRVYDNPGLTGDNFQMSNFPGHQKN
ncbi:mucin-15 isoform X1 [Pleuronectes platessa]|uniref:mucin-15 isoform X1 n=1 Tax=Pleuronectes platessa TaxID=8262 RepID=UPI00232A2A46|nr:mucin-15 isoform X1 [Pleuronectes platessa]